MTPRERVLAVLTGGVPDRIPWFGDLDYYASGLIERRLKPRDFKKQDAYLDWHRELQVGFYQQAYFPFREILEDCEVSEWFDGDRRYRRIRTPKGDLRECWQWSQLTCSEAPVERLVKGPEDLPAYRYRFQHTRYEPDYDLALRRLSTVGDNGIVMCFLPWSPLMRMVVVDSGILNVVMIRADAPEELEETLRVVKQSLDRACQIAVESPAEVLMITENLSSEVVGRELYDRYLKESYAQWSGKIKEAGKFSCIHMDGTLRGLLRPVSQIGFTFIEAMTPTPVGDLAGGGMGRLPGRVADGLLGRTTGSPLHRGRKRCAVRPARVARPGGDARGRAHGPGSSGPGPARRTGAQDPAGGRAGRGLISSHRDPRWPGRPQARCLTPLPALLF